MVNATKKTRLSSRVFQQSQFFSEHIDALFRPLRLNGLATPDPVGFWNMKFRGLRPARTMRMMKFIAAEIMTALRGSL
jgi:hypothetical protein